VDIGACSNCNTVNDDVELADADHRHVAPCTDNPGVATPPTVTISSGLVLRNVIGKLPFTARIGFWLTTVSDPSAAASDTVTCKTVEESYTLTPPLAPLGFFVTVTYAPPYAS